MKFVVFLDVDGVLNTKITVERTSEFYTGIDDARVEILAKAVRKYENADIVLSSDWKDMRADSDDFVILDDNKFDFRDYPSLWERLLITNGIERAKFASQTPAVETIIFLEYIKMFS